MSFNQPRVARPRHTSFRTNRGNEARGKPETVVSLMMLSFALESNGIRCWCCILSFPSPSVLLNYSKRINMSNSPVILKVVVVQGKRLVVRDFKSSDPYVVVKLGNQSIKTKVINSCLNPVWNEELTFSLTEPVGTLNLEVFDKDRFKADDKMGYAHLNIQPLVSAARLKQILKVSSGETTLRKVIPDSDNCLVRESCINCVNGDVVQDVWLRLCEVESGEIELKLKLANPNPVVLSS